jgi:hypothetical protein
MLEGNHRLSKAEGLGTGTCPAPSGESPSYAQEVYGGGNSPLLKITPGGVPEEIEGTAYSVPSGPPGIHFYEKSVQTSFNEDDSIPIYNVSSCTENSVSLKTSDNTDRACEITSTGKYFKDNQSSSLDLLGANLRSMVLNSVGLKSTSCHHNNAASVICSNGSSFSFGFVPTWGDSVTIALTPNDESLGSPIWAETDSLTCKPKSTSVPNQTPSVSIYFMVEDMSGFYGDGIIRKPGLYSRLIQNPHTCLTND